MHSSKVTMLLLGYFAGLALLIGGLASVGIKPDEQTIIGGMGAVAALFVLLWLIGKIIKHYTRKVGYSWKQWIARLLGASPEIVDAMPGSGSKSLVVSQYSTDMTIYQDGQGWEDDNEEDWSTFIEEDGLDLSDMFKPSFHSLLGQMVLVLGIRRYGKSNCIAVLMEALAPYGIPLLILDTKDEYAGLVNPQIMPYAVMAGAAGSSANVPQLARRYYREVDVNGAFLFGVNLMEGHFQVVLNLKSYETDDIAAKVMCEIIRGIQAWQEKRPNNERIPLEVVLSEGHKWLPQNEATDFTKDTQSMLHKTFFSTIVRLGGSYGFGFIVDSQRISELDKRCLQSTWKFLFKQSESIDIKQYEKLNLKSEDVLALQPGECFVFSPQVIGMPVTLYRKKSPDLSMTPSYAQLMKHAPQARAKHQMLAHQRSYATHRFTDDEEQEHYYTQPQAERQTTKLPEQFADHYQRQAFSYPAVTVPTAQHEEDHYEDEDNEQEQEQEQERTLEEMVLEQWQAGKQSIRTIASALDMTEYAVSSTLTRLGQAMIIEYPPATGKRKKTSV